MSPADGVRIGVQTSKASGHNQFASNKWQQLNSKTTAVSRETAVIYFVSRAAVALSDYYLKCHF